MFGEEYSRDVEISVNGVPDIHSMTQALNKYAYCVDNPLKYSDPEGEVGIIALVIVGLFVVAGLTGCEPADRDFNNDYTMYNQPIGDQLIFESPTKSASVLSGEMGRRGWTQESVMSVVNNPFTIRVSTNKANGNPATAYYDIYGNYVVVDDVTKEVVQVSDTNDPNWAPDSSIQDPYKPD